MKVRSMRARTVHPDNCNSFCSSNLRVRSSLGMALEWKNRHNCGDCGAVHSLRNRRNPAQLICQVSSFVDKQAGATACQCRCCCRCGGWGRCPPHELRR